MTTVLNPNTAILLAHGSNTAGWDAPFKALQSALQKDSASHIALAYLQFQSPSGLAAAQQAAAQGAKTITLIPCLLGQGAHSNDDIAQLAAQIKAQFPNIAVRVAPVLGANPEVITALANALRPWV